MYNIIENFINNMRKEDIIRFAQKNNLNFTEHEINVVYNVIKTNYKEVLNNPKSFDITPYKNEFSHENFNFIQTLINKYSKFLK